MSEYRGKWSVGRIEVDGKLTGVVTCPSDEITRHDGPNTACACDPVCYPLTGKDGDDVLGAMITHRPFCEL